MKYSEFRNQFSDVESFMRAYGRLAFEEAKAMIDAENAALRTKAFLISVWHEARREVKLRNVDVTVWDDHRLSIIIYEYDSDFDGNDFEYRYSLDAENAAAFFDMIPHGSSDLKTDIEEWLCEHDLCEGLGGSLRQEWIRMGLHGSHVVYEDYPGGIYREEAF